MFIYIFNNALYSKENRKIVLSFPIPLWMLKNMGDDGWVLVDLYNTCDNGTDKKGE